MLFARMYLFSLGCVLTSVFPLRSCRSLRAGALRPSPSSHGCHDQRLLCHVCRAAVAGYCRPVPLLARSPGGGHFASAPAALLLVVSRVSHLRRRTRVCVYQGSLFCSTVVLSVSSSQLHVCSLMHSRVKPTAFNNHICTINYLLK